jgi:hypothetical protein
MLQSGGHKTLKSGPGRMAAPRERKSATLNMASQHRGVI